MIAGATRIIASRRIVLHLLDAEANDAVEVTAARGLASHTLWDMVNEMDIVACHDRPLYHWHANPDPVLGRDLTEGEWSEYWDRVESEFGLELASFVEACHTKQGRPHRHRLYLLSRPDGTITPIDHDFRRRELISRLTEMATGQPITAGRHNAWVIAELRRRGEHATADTLEASGIRLVKRPAALSPEDRQADQRRTFSKAKVHAVAWQAWSSSDTWAAFVAALGEQGYRVGMGQKLPMLVAPDGGAHRLAQAIGGGAKLASSAPVPAKTVYERLGGATLPALSELATEALTPGLDVASPLLTNTEGHKVNVRPTVKLPRPRLVQGRQVVEPPPHEATRTAQAAARPAPETGPRLGARNLVARSTSDDDALSPSQIRILGTVRSRMEAAGARVNQFRQRVAAGVEREPPDGGLRVRVMSLVHEFSAPSISTADWRKEWRARLAGLPTEYGPRLRWVEQMEGGRIRVRLSDGVELLVADKRVTCSAGPPEDAIEPMLAHALTKGWQPLRVSGGTPEWRAAARTAAVAAGFQVLDEGLHTPVSPTERHSNAAR
ncbi:MAG: LPD7 domain-containing protein [Devosia sp.]